MKFGKGRIPGGITAKTFTATSTRSSGASTFVFSNPLPSPAVEVKLPTPDFNLEVRSVSVRDQVSRIKVIISTTYGLIQGRETEHGAQRHLGSHPARLDGDLLAA